jgi:hypothetical protein
MSRPPKDLWDDGETTPEDIQRRTANLKGVLGKLIKHALSTGPLDASRVAQWHKDLLSGLSYATDVTWLGAYRGSDHPNLENLGVRVGTVCGVSPHQVNEALVDFFEGLTARMSTLEVTIPVDRDKSKTQLRQIAELAGWAHGEWVRIHPFANGNGRTARLIANWVLSRFRLGPLVGVRPRPGHPYGPAGAASMRGDHRLIIQFVVDLLEGKTTR